MKTNTFLAGIMIMAACFFATPLPAQPGGPGGDPDTEIPIDGGVSLLVAAGIAYGAKKAYDKRKKDNTGKTVEK
ncbi:MAG: hypothetical protein KF862_26780 [Chitinophagaceae bacterium]|nr:hypothetical protein [Chitinophagaceae bacterium]